MAAAPPKSNNDVFKEYVQERKILIADSSATSRSNLAHTLGKLGAKSMNIALASTLSDAESEIARISPQIVICDFELGGQRGLELLQRQRAQRPDTKDSLFVLVTSNTSQSAVARAAEEDVDTFILKPFTAETLKSSLVKAALVKIKPTDYIRTIEEGKTFFAKNELDHSELSFKKAKTLDPAPALACYYLGLIQSKRGDTPGAEAYFNEGLGFNKLHYKCIVGLFDVMHGQKRWAESYEVAKRISQYFPANPTRLTQILKLAIITGNYEDVERYYDVFVQIDERAEEVVRHVCAALVVCGKFYLQRSQAPRALELFRKAAVSASGRTRVLREIIQALTEAKMIKEAREFLDRFPMETRRAADFQAMDLLIMDQSPDIDLGSIIAAGRKTLDEGAVDPLIYRIVIARTAQAGWHDSAEQLRIKALSKYPDHASWFELPEAANG